MKETILLQIRVTFDDENTNADAVVDAFDIMMNTALSTPDLLDDLGPIDVGSFEEVIDATQEPASMTKPIADALTQLKASIKEKK